MTCPLCGTALVRRAARRGAGEFLLGLALRYPFRCQLCTHRFLAFTGRPSDNPRRDYHRVFVRYPVSFAPLAEAPLGGREGTLVNLSMGGCRIQTSLPPPVSTPLRVEMALGDDQPPLGVEEAVVRYTLGNAMGLEFFKLEPEVAGRLRQLMEAQLRRYPL